MHSLCLIFILLNTPFSIDSYGETEAKEFDEAEKLAYIHKSWAHLLQLLHRRTLYPLALRDDEFKSGKDLNSAGYMKPVTNGVF